MDRLTKRVDFIQNYLDGIFAEDLHAKRVKSLTNGTLGVMTSASLAVSIIGQSLAQARGLLSKHAIKQVDRLLSNQGIVVWDMFAPWVDRFRRRRSDDAGLEPRHQPRPGDAFAMADRVEGRTERQAQRLRRPLPGPLGRGSARGRRGDNSGRSRLRRHQAVRLSRDPWASPTSSGFAATSMSARPMAKRAPPPDRKSTRL